MNNIERRLHSRHRASTLVHIKAGPISKKLKAINLSAQGVAIPTNGLGLRVNQEVDLTFVIDLGKISKLHKRHARVTHVTSGITGFSMFPYKA